MGVLLDEIATRIATLGATITGYTVDKGTMLDDTNKRIAVFEYQGFKADLGFGVAGIDTEYPAFQVTVRGEPSDYAGPRAVLQAIYLDLPKVQGTTLTGTFYHTIIPRQSPFLLHRDAKDRVVLACNFITEKEP